MVLSVRLMKGAPASLFLPPPPPSTQIPGNKMTAANLAVIFGPNLLQKERGADSNHHIYAMGIEDSAAIINVTLVLVQNYRRLFTVRANTQLRAC